MVAYLSILLTITCNLTRFLLCIAIQFLNTLFEIIAILKSRLGVFLSTLFLFG